jgi:hypothetical protein
MEAETPQEKAAAMAAQALEIMASDPEHADQRISSTHYDHDLLPVERPACAGCGATPLRLLPCSGTCGGKERFCDAACFARSWKEHRERCGCRKK